MYINNFQSVKIRNSVFEATNIQINTDSLLAPEKVNFTMTVINTTLKSSHSTFSISDSLSSFTTTFEDSIFVNSANGALHFLLKSSEAQDPLPLQIVLSNSTFEHNSISSNGAVVAIVQNTKNLTLIDLNMLVQNSKFNYNKASSAFL